MATKGFNFRQSSGFVTDLGNDTYVLSGDSYPTTRNGVTFGWESVPGDRDRNNAINAKLAGLCFDNGANTDFRVDMTGSMKFRLAMGDANFLEALMAIDLRDSLGSLDRVPNSGTLTTLAAENFFDPAETEHVGAAAWVASNAQTAALTVVGYARARLEPGAPTCIAHLELAEQAVAFDPVNFPRCFAPALLPIPPTQMVPY